MICALPFLWLTPLLPGQAATVEDIVCRVAENQARAREERNRYVYDMNVFVRMKRANGKTAREESREYVVAPAPTGAHRRLVKLEGKVIEGKREIAYTTARFAHSGHDVDAAVTDSFAHDVMWRRHTMGLWLDWFPLGADRTSGYEFRLTGEERYQDRDVYRVEFSEGADGEGCWSGEALIERQEFEPVLITSEWKCKIPRAVTVMLGTSVSQMGAKITYRKAEDGVWFPESSGGEMKVRVLFLYARTIAFSARNSGFRKTAVETSISFESG